MGNGVNGDEECIGLSLRDSGEGEDGAVSMGHLPADMMRGRMQSGKGKTNLSNWSNQRVW